MSTTEATPTESAINPAENLNGWLDDRDAKRAAEAAPAEPTVEAPAAPVEPAPVPLEGDWWEAGLANAKHGFLKGRKGEEVENAFRNAEARLKAKEQEASRLARELDSERRQREAEAAARKVAAEQRPATPANDPDAEIEALLLENPRAGIKKLRELATAEAERLAEAKVSQVRQETQAEQQKKQIYEAGARAYSDAQKTLNLDNDTWSKRSKAILVELTDQNSPYYGDGHNIFRPEVYVQVYSDLFGQPAPVVVKPAPEPPTPPGAKKPAAANIQTPSASPLTQEQIEARKRWAAIAGVDPKNLIARGEARKERTRG